MRRILFYLTFSNFLSLANAQSAADTVIFNALGNYNFSFTYSGYTPVIDRLGRPYVYLATKELGLVTFNISTVSNPVPVDTQTVTSLGNLKVTGVIQDNHYLYASLGDFQGTTQNAGLAVFDVTNPGRRFCLTDGIRQHLTKEPPPLFSRGITLSWEPCRMEL